MKKLYPVILLLVVGLLLLSIAPAVAAGQTGAIDGFLGNPWGSGFDQVKNNILARPDTAGGEFSEGIFSPRAAGMPNPSFGYSSLAFTTPINGQQHFVVLSFFNDKFYRVYAEREVSEFNMYREFETVVDMLRQKYGEPREQSGKNTSLVYRWLTNPARLGGANSITLSFEVVGPGTNHVNSNHSYYKGPKTHYYLVLEYEEGATAAIVDNLSGKKNGSNEY